MAIQSSAERRLQKLREQREAIDQKIKQVEQEKVKALRKVRTKRQSLVGAVVMAMVERGERVVIGSEADLLALMETALVRKSDRQAFGLTVEETSPEKGDSRKPDATVKEGKKGREKTSPPAAGDEATLAEKDKEKRPSRSSQKSGKRLGESGTQKEMMGEFNV